MDYIRFKEVVDDMKSKRPHLFDLENDRILSMTEIEDIEKKMDVKLPLDYCKFISEFGGGFFGFTTIYSLDEDSSYYMFQDGSLVPKGYLPVSDNGCGDIYMLKINEKQCLDEIYFFDHETNSIIKTKYVNILEYLVEVGLKQDC